MERLGSDNVIAARIGGNLKRYRLAQKLSQNAVAKKTGAVSGGDQVAKYERGEAVPRDEALRGLADALGVSAEHLLDPPELADARARALAAALVGARLHRNSRGTPPQEPDGPSR
jgi:transcriptional regulator with XRE-family HTH domain